MKNIFEKLAEIWIFFMENELEIRKRGKLKKICQNTFGKQRNIWNVNENLSKLEENS